MELKPFGIKAYKFFTNPVELDARFTILEGSIRSSKTWAMMVKLLVLSRYEVAGFKVITGVSKNTIYQNVLKDLFELVGKGNYRYNRQSGLLSIFGCEWLVIGAKDEGSAKLIQGMTIGVVYCDELTNMPESFFLMLSSRMSPAGARLYATCNPSHPYHYVKKDLIDNVDLKKAGLVRSIHFTLDDNPNLSREVRRAYERQYKGMFYLRMIKGMWVIAEGAIYRDVWDAGDFETGGANQGIYYNDATRPAGLFQRGGALAHYIGVDFGTHNPFVLLDCWDDGQTLWVEKEFYYDSQETRVQKTEIQYLDDVERFIAEYPGAQPEIIVDPSAAGFKNALSLSGRWVTDADNDVMLGIQKTSSLLAQRKIRINKARCPKLDMEMQVMAWDPKAAARGVEEPIKANDHAPDGLRYVAHTKIPEWRVAA